MIGKHDAAVAAFVDKFWQEHFYSPTFREIADGVGISSTSVVRNVIARVTTTRGDRWIAGAARGIIPRWVQDAIQGVHE
jgi:SOS-response transcriptional repressor LexA